MFLGVDAVVVRVPSLDEGLAFYRDRLGLELLWRRPDAAGLRLGDAAELVLATGLDPETDLLVADVDDAVAVISAGGGAVVRGPFDLDVGRAAVVRDPFGNVLTLVDLSRGRYRTGADGTVTGVGQGTSE
jgi:catechol 2,3-dioxygenase-like lactoylglutathione lyase family enzyme